MRLFSLLHLCIDNNYYNFTMINYYYYHFIIIIYLLYYCTCFFIHHHHSCLLLYTGATTVFIARFTILEFDTINLYHLSCVVIVIYRRVTVKPSTICLEIEDARPALTTKAQVKNADYASSSSTPSSRAQRVQITNVTKYPNNTLDFGGVVFPSAKFTGAKQGYIFKNDENGLGYYIDATHTNKGSGKSAKTVSGTANQEQHMTHVLHFQRRQRCNS